jgi:hypothetical protein
MSYWTDRQSELDADYSAHPWGALLEATIENAVPELHASLVEAGDFDAYLEVQVAEAVDEMARFIRDGDSEQEAKRAAIEGLLSVADDDDGPEDWEIEAGVEEAFAGLERQAEVGDSVERLSLAPGTTKVIRGRTYVLNENHRWTRQAEPTNQPTRQSGKAGNQRSRAQPRATEEKKTAASASARPTDPSQRQVKLAASKGDSPKHRKARRAVARHFFRTEGKYWDWQSKSMKPLDQEREFGMMLGIDWSKPVVAGPPPTVPPPPTLIQWQAPGGNRGSYFSTPDAKPHELGIGELATAWNEPGQPIKKREPKQYAIEKPLVYLRSIAAPTVDTWGARGMNQEASGGGIQWFKPHAADPQVTIKEAK